jgi:hypothetical protein
MQQRGRQASRNIRGADHGAGLSAAFLRKRSGLLTIIRNAKFRILPPQPRSRSPDAVRGGEK